jgi:gliding motility-associated-like protein
LVSQDGGPIQKIGETADSVLVYTHTNVDELATYCYCVRAVQNGTPRVTSTSNESCAFVYVPKKPDYGYQYNTTVQPGNTGVEDYFFSDSTAGYLGFEIQRGTEPDNMNFLWFIDFDPSTRFYDYVDAGAQPQNTSYYYSVIGIDSCDNYSDTLNTTRTIYLEATANQDRTNTLQWNAFEGWNGGVFAYNIYRSYEGPFTYLKTVGPNQLTALDSIEEILEGEGNFCYYIEAVEGPSTPVGTVDPVDFTALGITSRSNEACARQHPNLFIPNAFMPEGVNNVFKPVTIYVEADSYIFQVYNRWGQRVFETNDPNQGWDGSGGGKEYPQGAYVYFLSFVSSDGQTFTKNGSITLIR